MKLTLDNDTQVFFYEQEFYVLSNFSAFNVNVFGRDFQTAEHAYHWKKFCDTATCIASAVRFSRSAHAAFKTAESNKGFQRVDWDRVKVGFMRDILIAKVTQHEYVQRKLLSTGTRELIENSWRDSFWGWGKDRQGQNQLGRLWMEIRDSLKAKEVGVE